MESIYLYQFDRPENLVSNVLAGLVRQVFDVIVNIFVAVNTGIR